MRADRAAAATLLALLLLAGCARRAGPVPIHEGTPCSFCGMAIQDLSFASEAVPEKGATRFYDSIECLLGDHAAVGRLYVPDYDTRALHAADSLWIVKGRFPTPMGGGLAAFTHRAAAAEVASRAHGRVGRWSDARALLISEP